VPERFESGIEKSGVIAMEPDEFDIERLADQLRGSVYVKLTGRLRVPTVKVAVPVKVALEEPVASDRLSDPSKVTPGTIVTGAASKPSAWWRARRSSRSRYR